MHLWGFGDGRREGREKKPFVLHQGPNVDLGRMLLWRLISMRTRLHRVLKGTEAVLRDPLEHRTSLRMFEKFVWKTGWRA